MTGEKGMWMPVPVCDEEGDGKGGSGRGDGGDVRGEKGIEADFEVEEEEGEENVEVVGGDGDGDRVLEMKGYSGVGDVLERVWRKVERIGTAVLRKQRTVTANELGNGHDGDL